MAQSQPQTMEERVEEALARLYVANLVPNHVYINDTEAGCHAGNKESIARVINYSGDAVHKETIHNILEITSFAYITNVCDKTFDRDKALSYPAFLGRFLEKSRDIPPQYAFLADARNSSTGKDVKRNIAFAQNQFGICNFDFMLMAGLYCLYRADDFGMVKLEQELVRRVK